MIKKHMTRRKDDWPFPHRTQHFDAIGQAFAVALLILVIPGLSGCVNASLAAARSKLSDGQYAAAHEQLMAAAGQPQKLSAREKLARRHIPWRSNNVRARGPPASQGAAVALRSRRLRQLSALLLLRK